MVVAVVDSGRREGREEKGRDAIDMLIPTVFTLTKPLFRRRLNSFRHSCPMKSRISVKSVTATLISLFSNYTMLNEVTQNMRV